MEGTLTQRLAQKEWHQAEFGKSEIKSTTGINYLLSTATCINATVNHYQITFALDSVQGRKEPKLHSSNPGIVPRYFKNNKCNVLKHKNIVYTLTVL